MNFIGKETKELHPAKIEQLKAMFADFYTKYADSALPGQVEFMDSVYDQFNNKKYLSDKQILAIYNILGSCATESEYSNEQEWVY